MSATYEAKLISSASGFTNLVSFATISFEIMVFVVTLRASTGLETGAGFVVTGFKVRILETVLTGAALVTVLRVLVFLAGAFGAVAVVDLETVDLRGINALRDDSPIIKPLWLPRILM